MSINTELLEVVFATIITTITAFFIPLLNQIFVNLREKTNSNSFNQTFSKVESIVMQSIIHTSQTYVHELKKEGKFDHNAQQLAFEKTKKMINTLISDELLYFIEQNYTDFDLWLDTKIEASLNTSSSINLNTNLNNNTISNPNLNLSSN